MATNMRKPSGFVDAGSGMWAMIEIDPDTEAVEGSDVIYLPILTKSQITDSTDNKKYYDEGNKLVNTATGQRTVTFKGTVGQKDKATLISMVNTFRDKTYRMIKESSIIALDGTNIDYYIFPKVKPVSSLDSSNPGNEVGMEFDILAPVNEITFDIATFATTAFAATLTGTQVIPAGQPWDMVSIAKTV